MKLGYLEVADRIEEKIMSHKLQAGERLPGNRELAEELGVTPLTIQRALARLKDKGMINRAPRRGSFVNGSGCGTVIGMMFGDSPLTLRSPYYRLLLDASTAKADEAGLGVKAYYPMGGKFHEPFFNAEQDIAKGLLRCVVFACHNGKTQAWKQTGLKIPCIEVHGFNADAGTRIGTRHLVERGRRRIVLLSIYPEYEASRAKADEAIFRKELSDAGLNPDESRYCICGQYEMDGYNALKAIISEGFKFDGLLINHDVITAGSIMALLEAGLKIPSDVGVVTHSNKGATIVSHIPLTKVETDPAIVAATIVEAAKGMSGFSKSSLRCPSYPMEPTLIEGLSSKPVFS